MSFGEENFSSSFTFQDEEYFTSVGGDLSIDDYFFVGLLSHLPTEEIKDSSLPPPLIDGNIEPPSTQPTTILEGNLPIQVSDSNILKSPQFSEETPPMRNSNYPYQALQPSDSNTIKNTNSSLLQNDKISRETPPMTTPIYSTHPQNSPTIQYSQISCAAPPMANTFYSIHPQNSPTIQYSQMSGAAPPMTNTFYSIHPQNSPTIQYGQISGAAPPMTNTFYSINPQNSPTIQYGQMSGAAPPMTNTFYFIYPQNSPTIQYGQMLVETPAIISVPYPIQLQNSPNALFNMTNMTNSNSSSFCRCVTARAEVLNTQTHLPSGSGHQVSGSLEGASNSDSKFEEYTAEDLQQLFNTLYRQQSFCKECIFEIHNIIVQILKDEGVKTDMKKVTRDEHRSKKLYLKNNCKYYLIIKKYATKDIAEKARQIVYEEKKQKELKKQQRKMKFY